MSLCIKNYVIWFQISKDDVFAMQFFQSEKNFAGVKASLVFIKTLFKLQILCQVTSWAVV
jgi:hypothetical protein